VAGSSLRRFGQAVQPELRLLRSLSTNYVDGDTAIIVLDIALSAETMEPLLEDPDQPRKLSEKILSALPKAPSSGLAVVAFDAAPLLGKGAAEREMS
jgi:hypothetical protein